MKQIHWEQTTKQNEAWEFLNDRRTTELLFGGGAGGGKSFFGCAWLVIMCGQYPGTRWLMGRSKLKSLKETTLQTFFDLCKSWDIENEADYKYNSIDGTITWSNGSVILLRDLFLYPSDPNFDSLGSLEITGAFVDECNQIVFKAWEIVKSRIRYRLDEFGIIPKIIGTCNPSKQWVYTEFYKPWSEGKLEGSKQFVPALVSDNPYISKHYVENLKGLKDKTTRERLLLGNWEYDDDPSCLFDFPTIADLFSNHAELSTEKFIIGDVARKGNDRMPIMYWEGLQVREIHDLPYEIKKDTRRSAQWIVSFSERKGVRRSNILLDEDGVGGGVVDNIPGCVGFINNSPAIQPQETAGDPSRRLNYANLKTQCYFKLAQLAEEGSIGIDEPEVDTKQRIIEELEQVKQKDIDRDGKISLVGKEVIKENIGRSPDYADCLMMRMYYEVNKKTEPKIRLL